MDQPRTCGKCGHASAAQARSCLYCGAPMGPDGAETAPGPRKPAPPGSFELAPCPSCGHKVAPRMARCFYCGADRKPAAPAAERRCPRCRIAMEPQQATWVVVDHCPKCAGEFFDALEYERTRNLDEREAEWLQHHLDLRDHDTPDGKPLDCPGCAHVMDTYAVGADKRALIDRCRSCGGLWLDSGEAETLRDLVVSSAEAQRGGAAWYEPPAASGLQRTGRALTADTWSGRRHAQADLIALATDTLFDLLKGR